MKIKCLIVDDEKTARDGLRVLCFEQPDVEVVGLCRNGVEAIEQINALRPHLVLLDMQMPGINGLEVITSVPEPRPHVIFITAHDQFAIKAFEVNAVDYLLKPFGDERFEQAIARARGQIRLKAPQNLPTVPNPHIENSLTSLGTGTEDQLVVKVDGAIHLVEKCAVGFIEAYDYYVKIHLTDKSYMLRTSMKSMENLLHSNQQFIRTHKSFIVNRNYVDKLVKVRPNEYELVLKNGTHTKVSRAKIRMIKEWLMH